MTEFIDLRKCDRPVCYFNRFWRITVPFWSTYQSNRRRGYLGGLGISG